MQELKFKKIITSDHLQRPLKSKPLLIFEDDDVFYYVSYQIYDPNKKLNQYSVFINQDDIKTPKNVSVNHCVVDNTKIYMINKSDFLKYYNENKYLKLEDLNSFKQLQIFYNLSKNLNQNYLGLIEVDQKINFYTWYSHQELVEEDLKRIMQNPLINIDETINYKNLYEEILNKRNKSFNTLEFLEDIKIWVNEKIETITDLIYQLEEKEEEY